MCRSSLTQAAESSSLRSAIVSKVILMNHRNRPLWLLVLACCLVLPEWNQAQSRPAADLIITNAKIWTVDQSRPTAQAVAVLGDRIIAVGSNRTWMVGAA